MAAMFLYGDTAHAQVTFAGGQNLITDKVNSPYSFTTDPSGNLYMVDEISLYLDEFPPGGCGGCSPPVIVSNANYSSLAVDGSGNIFATGSLHSANTVLTLAPACRNIACATVIGGGYSFPQGIALDSAGDIYVTDSTAGKLFKVPPGCTSSTCTVTVLSGLPGIGEVAVDASNNLFIIISGTHSFAGLQKVPAGCSTGSCFITLISTTHNLPTFLSIDPSGTVYVTDFSAHTLTQIPSGCTTSSCMTTIGNLQVPYQVAADLFGNVYVSDYTFTEANHYVYEEQLNGVNFGTVSFGSTSGIFSLFFNFASATTVGSISALTQGATVDANGHALDFAVVSGGTCATGAQTAGSQCFVNVQFTPKGFGLRSGALVLKDSSSNVLATAYIFGNGSGPQASFTGYPENALPTGTVIAVQSTVDAAGNLYYADQGNGVITKIPPGGSATSVITGLTDANGVAVDGAGNIYGIGAFTSTTLKKLTPAGVVSTLSISVNGKGLSAGNGLAVDGMGNLYIGDSGNTRVVKVTPAGVQTALGTGLSPVNGLTVDGLGNIFVADQQNSRIVEFAVLTNAQSTAVSGLSSPSMPAVDGADILYIPQSNLVEASVGSNTLTPVSSINSGVAGVSVDGVGNLFISSTFSRSVVEAARSLPPVLSFGSQTEGIASSAQTVTITNTGNAPMIFTSFTAGTNAAVDATATTCSTTSNLAVGSSCNIGVDFDPASVNASLTGSVSVVANIANSPLTISLTGSGTAQNPTQLVYGAAPPVALVSGSNAGTVTVLVEDSSGNVMNLSTPTVTLTVTGPSSYSHVYSAPASAGVATFNLSGAALSTVGTYTYTATSGILTSAVATESVATPTKLLFASAPASAIPVGGNAGTLVVNVADAGNTLVAGDAGRTITLAVTATGYTQTYTAITSGGVASFNLSSIALSTAGTYTYTASASGLASAAATQLVIGTAYSFGSQSVNVATASQPVYFYFAAPTTPATIAVVNMGQTIDANGNALDFQMASGGTCAANHAYSAGDSCAVNVVFTPEAPGLRRGAVILKDSSGNVLASALLAGNGLGPVAIFGTISQSVIFNDAYTGGMALDESGNIYMADQFGQKVVKIPPGCASISCSTVIATGFNYIVHIAVDGRGDVYVSDNGNNRVVRVPAGCTSSSCWTLVGGGYGYTTGIAVDGAGNVYVIDHSSNKLLEVPPGCSFSSCATALGGVGSYSPYVVAVDAANNVYVGDTFNGGRILKMTPGCISSSCMQSIGPVMFPVSIRVDSAANVYVAKNGGTSVLEIPAGCTTSTCQVSIGNVTEDDGIEIDSAGNLYVGDFVHNTITKIARSSLPVFNFASVAAHFTGTTPHLNTVQNIGNATLNISSFSMPANFAQQASGATDCSGTATSGSALTTGTLTTSLATNASCQIATVFAPQTGGLLTGSITLTDNGANSPQSGISLSGTATQLSQSITFQPITPTTVTYSSGVTGTLLASATSGLTVTYLVSGPATISGSTLTYTGAGTVTVTAQQPGDATYTAATSVPQTITVLQATPSVSWTPAVVKTYNGAALGASVLNATSATTGSFSYTATLLPSGSPVSVSAASGLAAGSYTLTATLAPADSTDYTAASASISFTVLPQNIWVVNSNGSLSPMNEGGTSASGVSAIPGGTGTAANGGVAFNNAGTIWSVNSALNQVMQADKTGVTVNTLNGGGLNAPTSIAIDGNGAVWIANSNNSVSVFVNGGAITPSTGYTGGNMSAPSGIAIDISGNVWISNANNDSTTEILGGAAPVIPLAIAVQGATLGAKP